VVVTIGDAEVTNAVVGKEAKKWSFKDGDVTFLEASGEKSFAHKAVNEGAKPFVNYTIELKHKATLPFGKSFERLMTCGSLVGCQRIVAAGETLQCGTFLPADPDSRVILEDKPYLVVQLSAKEEYPLSWLKSGKDVKVPGASLTCEFGKTGK
jgi:hypothetical protein